MSDDEWEFVRDKLQAAMVSVGLLGLAVFVWAIWDSKALIPFASGCGFFVGVTSLFLPYSLRTYLARHAAKRAANLERQAGREP